MTTEKAQVRASVPTAQLTVDERLIEMQVGETRELKATVLPLLASEQKRLFQNDAEAAALLSMLVTDKIEWNSSNAEIASVDESGIVTAHKEGTVKITAKSGEHEIICNILVNVPIPEWASEEFLAYIERIGAYTELPLGTDGSAGPTAQYVTFGFTCNYNDFRCFNEIDERTKTTYKDYNYAKADDDEWYWKWGYTCYNTSHDHSLSTLEPYTDWRGETISPAPAAYKITPRKWRLLDKEKGLMIPESIHFFYTRDTYQNIPVFCSIPTYKQDITKTSYIFGYPQTITYKADSTKKALEAIETLCNYETSYLRAMLDGGENIGYSAYYAVTTKNGKKEWDLENGYMKFIRVEKEIYNNNGGHYNWSFAPGQLAQIKEVDLDCGEGGSVKGKFFVLSEDEFKSHCPIGTKLPYNVKSPTTFWTRTRKKINGKNTLCAVRTDYDDTVKEFVQLEGYDMGDYNDFIPAICVKPTPQE